MVFSTSVLLQCLACDKFQEKHSARWEWQLIPVSRAVIWKARNWKANGDDQTALNQITKSHCFQWTCLKTSSNCNCSSHTGIWPWHQDGCHLAQSPIILHGKEHSRLSLFFVSHSTKQHNATQFPLAHQFRAPRIHANSWIAVFFLLTYHCLESWTLLYFMKWEGIVLTEYKQTLPPLPKSGNQNVPDRTHTNLNTSGSIINCSRVIDCEKDLWSGNNAYNC